MPTPIAPVITNAGLSAALAANGLGLSLQITHGVLSPNAFTPNGTSTQADKREVALVASGAKINNQITITINWRAADYTGAAYNVGSVGFYAGDPNAGGILFAVVSAPDRAFPARGGTAVANYTQTYTLTLSGVPEGSVNVSIDPMATVAMAALSAHIAATNPHPQYMRTIEALVALNGWTKTPVQTPAGGFLVEQWCRVYIGNPPPDGGFAIPFNYPIAMNGFIGAWVTTILGDSTAIRVGIESPTLTGAVIRCQEWDAFTQNVTAQVLIKGYIGPSVPAGLIPGAAPAPPPGGIVASFSQTPADVDGVVTIIAGDSVSFSDTSTETPTSWYWDFGDGTTSVLQNPVKTYGTAGTYTVSLTASKVGSSDTEIKTSYIIVGEATPP